VIEFLVHITVVRPDTVSDSEWAQLRTREAERGRAYRDGGVIRRIWRLPGTTANVGIWAAKDPTELHEKLAALPMFAHMTIGVAALADHYLDSPNLEES